MLFKIFQNAKNKPDNVNIRDILLLLMIKL